MPKSIDLILQGLRVSLPTLKSCTNDLIEQAFKDEFTKNPTDEEFKNNIIISTFPRLSINNSSENLLIGEKFEMILRLVNSDDSDCKIVSIIVDLSVDKYSYRLYESDTDFTNIPGHGKRLFRVNHIITHAGQYTMQCVIKAGSESKPTTIKRTYKFTAMTPFTISHRSSMYNNITYLQTSITNISERSLTLLDAELNSNDSNWSIITPRVNSYLHYLRPMDIYNMIILIPRDTSNINSISLRDEVTKATSLRKSISSNVSDSSGGFVERNSTTYLSIIWTSDSTGESIFSTPLEISNQSRGISFRVIKIPNKITVPAYFDAKFEIRNEGTEHMYCKILIGGNLSLDETVEVPIEAGLTITQTYTLHIEQTGLISLDSVRLLTWTHPPKTIKEYPLLDPPSILCL